MLDCYHNLKIFQSIDFKVLQKLSATIADPKAYEDPNVAVAKIADLYFKMPTII